MGCVGNVFWLPIRQFKFFGTIEFLVSILDLNIFKFAALFAPWKISRINLIGFDQGLRAFPEWGV